MVERSSPKLHSTDHPAPRGTPLLMGDLWSVRTAPPDAPTADRRDCRALPDDCHPAALRASPPPPPTTLPRCVSLRCCPSGALRFDGLVLQSAHSRQTLGLSRREHFVQGCNAVPGINFSQLAVNHFPPGTEQVEQGRAATLLIHLDELARTRSAVIGDGRPRPGASHRGSQLSHRSRPTHARARLFNETSLATDARQRPKTAHFSL
jgi:hypothetical protein